MKNIFKLLSVLYFCLTIVSFAKDINIGDLVKLKISKDLTKENLMKKFEKFDIEEIKDETDSYIISFRIYEVGVHEIELGNTFLKLEVKSVLEESDKEIKLEMENGENLKFQEIKAPFPYEIFLTIPIVILIYFVVKFIRRKKESKLLSPIEEFNKNIAELNDAEFYFQISYSFRKYLDRKIGTKLLSGQYEASEHKFKDEIQVIIKKLDQHKFNPLASLSETRENIKNAIIYIVEKIEKIEKFEELEKMEEGENNGA